MKLRTFKIPMVFLVGILVGVMITGVVAAQTNLQVSAFLDNGISVIFNGQQKTLPSDMDIIIYNNRTYTPARFIAEELGAEVGWDPISRSVMITWEEPEVTEPVEPEPVDEEEDETEEVTRPRGDYREVPITKITSDVIVGLTNITFNDNDTWFYFDVEGRLNQPIQFDQRSAKLTVNGTTYLQPEVKNIVNPIDTRWFNDIREDERVSGWIKFGAYDEDEVDYMILEVDYVINDGSQRRTTLKFEIEL